MRNVSGPEGAKLFDHLREILALFQDAGGDAAGELAGKMLLDRLRIELAGRRSQAIPPKQKRVDPGRGK